MAAHFSLVSLLLALNFVIPCIYASPYFAKRDDLPGAIPKSTTAPTLRNNATGTPELELRKRQITTQLSTCGFYNGDPTRSRTADAGFNCRFDTLNGLWGFCPATVILATDCGLAGNCIDSFSCSRGCGKTGIPGLTTFTCSGTQLCSTAIVTLAVDAVFSYIACGAAAVTDHLLISPTPVLATTTPLPSISKASSSSISSISSNTSPASTSSLPSSRSSAAPTITNAPAPGAQPDFSGAGPTDDNPPPSLNTSPANPSGTGSGSSIGAIVGGVVGGLAVLSLSGLGLLWLMRNQSGKSSTGGKPGGSGRSRFSMWPQQQQQQTRGVEGSVGQGAQVRAPSKSEWDGYSSTDPDGRTSTVPSISSRGDSAARGSGTPERNSQAGLGPSELYVPYEQPPASGRNYAPVEMPG